MMGFLLKLIGLIVLVAVGMAIFGGEDGSDWALATACMEVEKVAGVDDCGIPVAGKDSGSRITFAGEAALTDGRRVTYSGSVDVLCRAREASCYRLRALRVGDKIVAR
jgi:hypothetical protein